MEKKIVRKRATGKRVTIQPPTTTSTDDDIATNGMVLDDFKIMSTYGLKAFLSVRKKKTTGTFDELIARYDLDMYVFHSKEEKKPGFSQTMVVCENPGCFFFGSFEWKIFCLKI